MQRLERGMKTLDISRRRKRDRRTGKTFVVDSEHRRVRTEEGRGRKVPAGQIHWCFWSPANLQVQDPVEACTPPQPMLTSRNGCSWSEQSCLQMSVIKTLDGWLVDGGVMARAVGPLWVPEGVKMTSAT